MGSLEDGWPTDDGREPGELRPREREPSLCMLGFWREKIRGFEGRDVKNRVRGEGNKSDELQYFLCENVIC